VAVLAPATGTVGGVLFAGHVGGEFFVVVYDDKEPAKAAYEQQHSPATRESFDRLIRNVLVSPQFVDAPRPQPTTQPHWFAAQNAARLCQNDNRRRRVTSQSSRSHLPGNHRVAITSRLLDLWSGRSPQPTLLVGFLGAVYFASRWGCEKAMGRALMIGGVFLLSRNPEALAEWYHRHLELELVFLPDEGYYTERYFRDDDAEHCGGRSPLTREVYARTACLW
jgi:hypothetical protein